MGTIKINLNKEIAKFKVKFDPETKNISFWKGASRANGHMLFDTGGVNYIQFNLAPVPGREKAEIVGISFEDDQVDGIIEPKDVFSPVTKDAIPADPDNNRTVLPFPEEVLARLQIGDTVAFGYYPTRGEPMVEEFYVAEEPAELASISEQLAEQPEVLRRHFRAQVFRRHGLWLAVLAEAREIERLCGDEPSARALALQVEAYRKLGMSGTLMANAVAGPLYRMPPEELDRVLQPRD